MAIIGVLIWVGSGVLAYVLTDAAARCYREGAWDRAAKEFAIVSSALLGPIYLLISAELLLIAAIGKGLAGDHTRRYKDS
jgi:hypothetical protein